MSSAPVIKEVLAQRQPVQNVKEVHCESLSPLDRVALWITSHVGTMGFFMIIFAWTAIWLTWNFLAPKDKQFDPPMAFVFYLFISNVIQICLMPLIMVGQNLQNRQADIRSENDYEVNIKAEREIETILLHIERQNEMLFALMEKVGVDVQALKQHEDGS